MTFIAPLLPPLLVAVTIPLEGVEGTILRLGAVAGAAVLIQRAWAMWGRPTVQWFHDRAEAQEARLMNIEAQLCVNGDEDLLPEQLRGKPLRTVVGRLATWADEHDDWSRATVERNDAEHVALRERLEKQARG